MRCTIRYLCKTIGFAMKLTICMQCNIRKHIKTIGFAMKFNRIVIGFENGRKRAGDRLLLRGCDDLYGVKIGLNPVQKNENPADCLKATS